MATRRLAGLAAAAAVLALAAPLSGQLEPEYTWTEDRPDGVGPVGVTGERTYSSGELSVYYRFIATAFEGPRVGEVTIPPSTVLADFQVAPLRQEVLTHLVGGTYGLTDRITLEGTLPLLVSKDLDHVIEVGTQSTDLVLVQDLDGQWGIGDLQARGHLLVYDDGPYRAHATMGLSIPIGSISQEYLNPETQTVQLQAPYNLQIGSGTVDLLPGVTVLAMNDRASTGIQANAILRLYDNSRGYHFGHTFGGSVWGTYRFTDMVSLSVRTLVQKWLDVQGADPAMDPFFNPAARPDLQGGTRVELPLGVNVLFQEGFLEGHRVGLEASFPMYESLHGPQLEHGWTLTLGWDYGLSLLGAEE